MVKTVELPNGAIIKKIRTGDLDEEWYLHNETHHTLKVKLDLSNWFGYQVEGFEGEQFAEAELGPLEKDTLFTVHRIPPPFNFDPVVEMEEVPAPMSEQEKFIEERKREIEEKVDRMGDLLQSIPFDIMDQNEIKQKLREFRLENFLDPSFPPTDTSLYDLESEEEYPLDEKPVWKRPKEFMENPELYHNGIDPNDINQGALGNCWFMASIASVAEIPALIKRLFITKEYNEEGIYQMKLCKNGEWVKVTVDDYFPCYIDGGPMFCNSTGDELWVLLLEKAYAKLHGNYCQLRGGWEHHGMQDLTGCPTRYISFPEDKEDLDEIKEFSDDLWEKLDYADSRGWVMCAGTDGVDEFTEGDGPSDSHGIVPGHAYSVIDAREREGVKLVHIRNPWGEFEWGGAWSDNSKKWTEKMIKAFEPKLDENDGSFWMSYNDFLRNYSSLWVCKVENWNEVRLKGIFMRCFEIEDKDEDFVLSKFYYSFRLEQESVIEIGLHQEDERILGSDRRRNADMQIIVLRRHALGILSIVHDTGYSYERDQECRVQLQPGHYIVIPRTSGAQLSKPSHNPHDPIELKLEADGREVLHPVLKTTMDDIFRRMDLQLNGTLSAKELNQFGKLIGNEQLENITRYELMGKDFEHISWDWNGMTNYGLRQYFRKFEPEQIAEYTKKLGYDESLYSTKSKPFTITFHTRFPLRVRIGNAFKTNLNERAWDLMMHEYHKKNGATGAKQNDTVWVFKREYEESYCVDFAAINKTDKEIVTNFNMTDSCGMIYQPSKGTVRTVIPPKSLVYLGSGTKDPDEPYMYIRYRISDGSGDVGEKDSDDTMERLETSHLDGSLNEW